MSGGCGDRFWYDTALAAVFNSDISEWDVSTVELPFH
jgi:hypothetical protein